MNSLQEDIISFDEEEKSFSFFVDTHHLRIFQYLISRIREGEFLEFVNMGLSAILDTFVSCSKEDDLKPKCEYFGQEKNPLDIISDESFPLWIDNHLYLTNQVKRSKYKISVPSNEETKELLPSLLFAFNKYEKATEVMTLFIRFLLLLVFLRQKNFPLKLYSRLPKPIVKRNGEPCFIEFDLFDMYDFPIIILNS